MPQGPLFTVQGTQQGTNSALNVTAATLVKGSTGRLSTICINTVGSAGTLNVYDSATTAGASASNLMYSLAYNAATAVAGAVFFLDIPFQNGLVVTPATGQVVSVAFS